MADVLAQNGIKLKNGAESVLRCKGNQNDTFSECPVANNIGKDFIVAVQNTQIKSNNGFIRIIVPNLNYSAQVWDKSSGKFVDTPFDINENKHFDRHGNLFSDFEIFIKSSIKPDEI